MAEAEREKIMLERIIRILKEWTVARNPVAVQLAFLELRMVNQNTNTELWQELRSVLGKNPDLLDDDLQSYIYEPELAKNGWWWYDRANWKK